MKIVIQRPLLRVTRVTEEEVLLTNDYSEWVLCRMMDRDGDGAGYGFEYSSNGKFGTGDGDNYGDGLGSGGRTERAYEF